MSGEIIVKCRNTNIYELSNWKKAIKIAGLDDNGHGYLCENDLPPSMRNNNGKTWARSAEKHFIMRHIRDDVKVVAWEFAVFTTKDEMPSVPRHVRHELKERRCVVLSTRSNVEIDHKYANSPHGCTFYSDRDFANDETNYQPLARVVNDKKREDKKRRARTGYKFDNRHNGLAFSTTRNSLKDDATLITKEYPYDGEYWTDPRETLRLDRRLYASYFSRLSANKPGLTHKIFEQEYLPKINTLIDS